MEFKCEYCATNFSSTKSLYLHNKNAAYCKAIKGVVNEEFNEDPKQYKKQTLDKAIVILSKQIKTLNLELIDATKIIKTKTNENESLIKENNKLKNKAGFYKSENKSLHAELVELKDKLSDQRHDKDVEIAHKDGQLLILKDKSITTNNTNNSTINKNKIINYIHPKLANTPIDNIHPLTDDYVEANAHKYTYNRFKNGAIGVSDFILDIVMLKNDKGEIERNYACTDQARNSFYILELLKDELNNDNITKYITNETNKITNEFSKTIVSNIVNKNLKKWAPDGKANYIDIILSKLAPYADDYWKSFDERNPTINIQKIDDEYLSTFPLDKGKLPTTVNNNIYKSQKDIEYLEKINNATEYNTQLAELRVKLFNIHFVIMQEKTIERTQFINEIIANIKKEIII